MMTWIEYSHGVFFGSEYNVYHKIKYSDVTGCPSNSFFWYLEFRWNNMGLGEINQCGVMIIFVLLLGYTKTGFQVPVSSLISDPTIV